MSLLVFSQFTKPEGTIRFDDLVMNARKKGIKYLGLTDHGNFSGIAEFYNKCLDAGIKPLAGIDFFCRLENGSHVRIELLAKNYSGYRNILKLVPGFIYAGRTCICSAEDLTGIGQCFVLVNMFRFDVLSEGLSLESDPVYVLNRMSLCVSSADDIFFVVNEDFREQNSTLFNDIVSLGEKGRTGLVECGPVYYLNEDGHKIKEFASLISGYGHASHYRGQHLKSGASSESSLPPKAKENASYIAGACHFRLEEVPVRFPEFRLNAGIEYSYFDTLRTVVNPVIEKENESVRSVVVEELAFSRKHNISSIMLFLLEVKKEFYNRFGQDIFFSGFISDLHMSYILGLTLTTPLFSSSPYHRSLLANKKIHPVITAIVSPENRQKLFEYMSEKFPEDTVCFLSDYIRWHFNSIVSSLTGEHGISAGTSELLYRHYNPGFRSSGQLKDIMETGEVRQHLEREQKDRDILQTALWMDEVFRNYSTNTNQMVISSENISGIIPVHKNEDIPGIGVSFFNMSAARHFGIWNINIESNSYLETRRYFGLGPVSEKEIRSYSDKLVSAIRSDELEMIPYFSLNRQRERFFDLGRDSFFNLILYLESGRFNLNFLFTRSSPVAPGNRFKKELSVTRGFIVFREQFYYVCDKLFTSKETVPLRKRLLESSSMIQFNSILNQISENSNCREKCEYLKSAVQHTVFSLSLSESSYRVIIAVRTLILRTERKDIFIKYYFEREIRSGGDWRKHIGFMQRSGYRFIKISPSGLVKEPVVEEKRIFLPLYCIKGISPKISDHIYGLIRSEVPSSFREFLESADKNIIKHNTVEILVRSGFFDIFNANRKELINLNDIYFRSVKKDDSSRQELFSASEVEITVDQTDDISLEEKMRDEEDLTGLVFSSLHGSPCEVCGFIKTDTNENVVINRDIYENSDFVLHAAMNSGDFDKIDSISEFLDTNGNCSVEIYFSDSRDSVKLKEKIILNDLNFYKIRQVLYDVPFYLTLNRE